jgi:tRNA nucleotidyltransferase (CCA-adding enzyme)
MGRHVLEMGVPPGPSVGEVLKAIYEMQLDGVVQTLDDAKAQARAFLARAPKEG